MGNKAKPGDKRLGNQFWKARAKHGRDKIFSTPKCLWDACVEYFQWVEDNPLLEQKIFHTNGQITKDTVSKMRAMTLTGLRLFLGIDAQTWLNYKELDDFIEVITRAEEIIYEQKFTGAAADMLNPNIIARDLGLADKQEVKQTQDIKVTADMSPQDAAKAYQDLMNG